MRNIYPRYPKAVVSFILTLVAIASYVASVLVGIFLDFASPGFFWYILPIYALCGITSLLGLIFGIGGVRQQERKALAIISIIICILILGIAIYAGINLMIQIF